MIVGLLCFPDLLALEGTVHEPTQRRPDGGADLSVAEICAVAEPGRVDFGGGELEPATLDPHPCLAGRD